MSDDYPSEHEHKLSAEYLYPSDAEVLDIYSGADGQLRLDIAVPCPECSDTVALSTTVDEVTEAAVDLPLGEEYYD